MHVCVCVCGVWYVVCVVCGGIWCVVYMSGMCVRAGSGEQTPSEEILQAGPQSRITNQDPGGTRPQRIKTRCT